MIVQDIYSRGVVETGSLGGRSANLVRRLESTMLGCADSVAVIHSKFVEVLAAVGAKPKSVAVIRNWTHLHAIDPCFDRGEVRRRHGWAPSEIIALHAGNMGLKQGLDNVISAARLTQGASCGRESSTIRFVLLGDGSQRRDLEASAKGVANVQMITTLPDNAFRDALAAADLLLVNERPGVADMAVPSKLTSYLMSERPIVAATERASGTASEIAASGNGVIVAPGDPQALVDGIRELMADREGADAMARAGVKFALETLDQEVAIDNYDQWCQDLARGTTARSLAAPNAGLRRSAAHRPYD